jgi:hypothetical protein
MWDLRGQQLVNARRIEPLADHLIAGAVVASLTK